MFYTTHTGQQILDGASGLWCCNTGHCHPKIVEAVQQQAATLDYATAFQLGHPTVFEMAEKLVDIAPDGLTHVFFTNSGSEAVDTALKNSLGIPSCPRGRPKNSINRSREGLSWSWLWWNFGGWYITQ